MRAAPPPCNTALIAAQFEAAPGIERVRALTEGFAAATPETVAAILDEASRFAQSWLVPLNDASDAEGCRRTLGHGPAAARKRGARSDQGRAADLGWTIGKPDGGFGRYECIGHRRDGPDRVYAAASQCCALAY